MSLNPSEKFNGFFTGVQRLLAKKKAKEEARLKEICEFKDDRKRHLDLLQEIEEVKLMLKQANVEFNSQTNSDLIESCIYNLESLETKYNYLIKEARKQKIRCDAKVICITG